MTVEFATQAANGVAAHCAQINVANAAWVDRSTGMGDGQIVWRIPNHLAPDHVCIDRWVDTQNGFISYPPNTHPMFPVGLPAQDIHYNPIPPEQKASALAKNVENFSELKMLLDEAVTDQAERTWVAVIIPNSPLKFEFKLRQEVLHEKMADGSDKGHSQYDMKTVFNIKHYSFDSVGGFMYVLGDRAIWSFGFDLIDFAVMFESDPGELLLKGTFSDLKQDIETISRWGVKALLNPKWSKFADDETDT